jgi:hypothetical protein
VYKRQELASVPDYAALEQRLLSRVQFEPNSGCWLWEGATVFYGYGVTGYDGKSKRVHRLSWEIYRGPIPAGMVICHRCDTPPCANPDHLFLGTRSDNNYDCVRKGRANNRTGEQKPNAVLTSATVREIWLSPLSQIDIARRLSLNPRTVSNVRIGATWRSVTSGLPPQPVRSRERPRRRKISEETVERIRTARNDGETLSAIAERFGITSGYVHKITSGQTRTAPADKGSEGR